MSQFDRVKGFAPGPEVEEFAEALDRCLAKDVSSSERRARLLDLPRRFHENALRRLMHKRPKRKRDGNDDVDMDVDDQYTQAAEEPSTQDSREKRDIEELELEIQTWDLVRRLLPLGYADLQPEKPGPFSQPTTAKPSQANSLQDFLQNDPLAIDRRAVIQWLQTTAASGPSIDELVQDLQQNADRGDIIAHGWLHTRSKIKLRKSVTAWPHLLDKQSSSVATSHVNLDGAPLVTQLDPDASTRQGRKLEPQDEYFERAIWLGCFEHLRRGSSEKVIREWCQERTEMWRAISMSGLLLSADGVELLPDANPQALVLWRRMCLSLAKGGGSDDFERATYGILAGDISSVEKVARTWDDYLFAHYNALLRTQIDNFLLGRCPPDVVSSVNQSFPSFDAIQFHGESEGVEKRLVLSLENQRSTREEATKPHKALQAAFIAKDIDRHLYQQACVLTDEANKDERSLLLPQIFLPERSILSGKEELVPSKFYGLNEHKGLRIVCHVYVLIALLRQLDASASQLGSQPPFSRLQSGQESIVAGYTDFLARANLMELIPLYCSVLQTSRQYEVLSWNLINVSTPDRRMTQLKLIDRIGIDVLEFVKTMGRLSYENLDHSEDAFVAKDSFRIVGDGPPSTRQGRGIKADFLGDDDAVVPSKDELVIRSLEWLVDVDTAWPQALHIGVQAYKFFLRNAHLVSARKLMERVQFDSILLSACSQEIPDLSELERVDYWAQQLEQTGITGVDPRQVMTDARNFRELEHLVKALDSLETIGSLMKLSEETSSGDRKFWSGVSDAVRVMRERMQPLLGGWMVASIDRGDEELRELRQVFLPEAILAYVSGLHYAGTGLSRDNLLECMELASVVAERNSDLAKAFIEAGRMRELVEAFTACSKALATSSGDKKSAGSSSKKLRETGWSRDIWAVR